MNRYPIYQLTMPIQSILPVEPHPREPVQDPPLFDLPFPAPANETEECAIAVWINSHLIFFLSLNVATFAARQACMAAKEADVTSLTHWLDRLCVLRLASVAFTCTAANLTQEVYESYIRPAMQSMRADFSGVSSPDNGAYVAELSRMKEAIGEMLPTLSTAEIQPIQQALAAYGEAEKVWWGHHGVIMRRLISTPHSLARQAYQRQVEEKGKQITYEAYKHETLRTPEALSENDRFFAVRRGGVSLLQFRHNLQHTLEVLAPYRIDDPELTVYWQAGVKLMLQIIDEDRRFTLATDARRHSGWRARCCYRPKATRRAGISLRLTKCDFGRGSPGVRENRRGPWP